MLMVNQLCGFGVNNANKAPPAFSLDFIDSGVTAGAGTSQSVTLDFGDEPPAGEHRYIVAAIGVTSVASVDAVTIGGVSATVVAAAEDNNTHGLLAIAEVPTGTSGAVAITVSDTSATLSGAATYRLMNPASATPHDTATDTGGGGNDGVATLTLDIPAGGAAVGIATCRNDLVGTGDDAWVGLVTDGIVAMSGEGANEHINPAHLVSEAGSSPLTVTCTTNANDIAGASASWGPITS